METVLFAAAGTAGHINPALATADELKKEGFEIIFLGGDRLETKLVPESGYELFQIEKTAVFRELHLFYKNFALLFKLIKTVSQIINLFRERNIKAVVSFGGYISAPAVIAAKIKGLPIIVHEQNSSVGLANKLAAKLGSIWCYTFPETKLPKSSKKTLFKLIGMPQTDVKDLENSEIKELDSINNNLPILLITGGSLGAVSINKTIEDSAPMLIEFTNIIHITGKNRSSNACEIAKELNSNSDSQKGKYKVFEYSNNLKELFKTADLIISRAGASSVIEIFNSKTPAIFVPLPYGNGEQKKNASFAKNRSIVIEDSEFNLEYANDKLTELIKNPQALIKEDSEKYVESLVDAKTKLVEFIRKSIAHSVIKKLKRTHFIAISGAGMKPIANCFERFSKVTGCDKQLNGHSPKHLKNQTAVCYSSAIKKGNPELDSAFELEKSNRIKVLHRSDALKLLLDLHSKRVIVAGSHGKTTISAMLASIFDYSDSKTSRSTSSFIIGAKANINGTETNGSKLSQTGFERIVAEADESDGSFRKYKSELVVIPNIESDHLDFYNNFETVKNAFLTVCSNSKFVITTAEVAKLLDLENLKNNNLINFGFEIVETDCLDFELQVPGNYNRVNASLALTAAKHLGIQKDEYVNALTNFKGAKRRFEEFEFSLEAKTLKIVDDYAHHPTEVQNLILGAKEKFRNAKIIALFQPHLFSRTNDFAKQFADALDLADSAIVTRIYPARETQEQFPNISPKTISDHIPSINSTEELIDGVQKSLELARSYFRTNPEQEVVILTIGAGDSLIPMFENELGYAK